MTGVKDLLETATNRSSSFGGGAGSRYRYGVYGMVVSSDTPLDLPSDAHGGVARVECVSAPDIAFLAATENVGGEGDTESWYRCVVLRDGSTYVRWRTIGEFLVAADGRRIMFRRFDRASLESFQVYLLGQALSFALVRQGFEPLHATAVVVDRHAVAFLGSNAFGKSSLAASFLEAGARLLTDDLLILSESGNRVLAYPGPPRLKLFPKIARRFLGQDATNRVHMNPDTDKLILPIGEHRRQGRPVALEAIYALAAPRDACRTPCVRVENLSPREAFLELLKGTFNRRLTNQPRLARQFDFAARLTDLVAVKKLTYPRAIDRLPEVREAVRADLARDTGPALNVQPGFLD
jgi:hypothetical protein